MKCIIVSDIFGRTADLEHLADALSSPSITVTLLDPYEGQYMAFGTEAEAYDFFQSNVGLDGYEKILMGTIKHADEDLLLIGFSVGASAVWSLSNKKIWGKNTKAICFYGSRIRHLLHVTPKIEIELFFPDHEPHFDVDQLVARLSEKSNVTCVKIEFLHGFMNKKSINYNKTGALEYLQLLKENLA